MKKFFTYSLALIGMLMCSMGANAQETTQYRPNFDDFVVEGQINGNCSWDAATKTITWDSPSGNNVLNVKFTGLPEGKMPAGTKFVVKAKLVNDAKSFRMFIGGDCKADCGDGENVMELTAEKVISEWRVGGPGYQTAEELQGNGGIEIEDIYIERPNGTIAEDPLPSIIPEPAAGANDQRISVDMSALQENWGQGVYDPTTHLYTANAGYANLMDLAELVNMDSKYKRVVVNVSYVNTDPESCRFCTGDGATLRIVLLKEGINEIEITSADDLSRVRIGGRGAGHKMVIHYIYADNNTATAINNVAVESAADAQLYNAAGQKVGKNYKGLVMQKNGKKWMQK